MSKLKQKARVELLTELHRPLEEHWAAAPRLGLDAKGSDYVYKFHIARLQDIYSGQEIGASGQIQNSSIKEVSNESPATQLYGVRGILSTMTPEREEKMRQKELSWDNGVDVNVNILNQNPSSNTNIDSNHNNNNKNSNNFRSESPSGRRSRTGSPFGVSRGGDGGDSNKDGRRDIERSSSSPSLFDRSRNTLRNNNDGSSNSGGDIATQRSEVRCRYDGDKLQSSELKILGMYKLNEDQRFIYEAFVDMLSTMDEFDRQNVVDDALLDAEEVSSIAGYTGIGLPKKRTEK